MMQPAQFDAYLVRLGLGHLPKANEEGLALFQRAHRLSIPFENFDIHLGRGISIALDRVVDKLVRSKRGGYCFEHNALFSAGLAVLGFNVRPILARVWLVSAPGVVPPRTHVLSLVTIGDRQWIADAGFGGGYAPPMLLEADRVAEGPDGGRHRLVMDADHGWMLEREGSDGWRPQFSFSLDAVYDSDLVMSNHWTSTSPDSRFVRHRIASMVLPHGMAALQDCRYTRSSLTDKVDSEITSARMLQMRLSLVFGIDLERDQIAALNLL
ncbi:arylamine N-acetyltransferase family protein [Aquisediminimonas sediminicola]|uniref:arylamine N-acetyltransferase family protein n=1 Tax=Alteraquisediminimonas sediminicola TaxID=2676787 RepID=UPI001FEA1CE4|nr:arylamine N-acetyltransferase [Aquisediminimonas sediminicola]